MLYFVFYCLIVIYTSAAADQLPQVGKRESKVVCYSLLVIMWILFMRVSSSSVCLGWAALFYCGIPWAFHIIIKKNFKI